MEEARHQRPLVLVVIDHRHEVAGHAFGGGLACSDLLSAFESIVNGTIAQSRAQADRPWLLREAMAAAQSRSGPRCRTDISVPLAAIPAFLAAAFARLAADLPDARPIAYGHAGSGDIPLAAIRPRPGRSSAVGRCSAPPRT